MNRSCVGRARAICLCLVVNATSVSPAQLVADSATNTLSNVTNDIAGDVTVGANGSLTLLTISDNALLTNSANGIIGRNNTANSNEVQLVSPTARWQTGGSLFVGSNGAAGRLVVSNGAMVRNNLGYIGYNPSSSNNEAVVTGPSSLWTNAGDFFAVGYFGPSNRLVVSNGAVVGNDYGSLGAADTSSSNNLALVTGPGSLWNNLSELDVGGNGSGNQLVVTNGAVVRGGQVYIGLGSSKNLAVVTDSGSLWSNSFQLFLGYVGAGNQMVVSNGGVLLSDYGYLGFNTASSSNLAMVTGPGSAWTNFNDLDIGESGGRNTLVVSNGGVVFAGSNVFVGVNPTSTNNRVVVDGGTLRATNASVSAALDIRRGTTVLNTGSIEVDQLLLTNVGGFLQFNGGMLSAKNSRISHGSLFRVGDGVNAATFILAGNGLHELNALLAAQVSSNATVTGNGTFTGATPLQLLPGSRLIPGLSVGQMIFSNSPVLKGTVVMEISRIGTMLTNDQIQVIAPLTYGGSLVVSNLGPTALAIGDCFPLFGASSYAGGFTNIILPPLTPGLGWTNKLLADGSIEVIAGPKFTSITLSGSNVILAGANGTPNAPYAVLTATNVATPLTNWVSLITNQFDASGNFSFTNPIAPGEPQRYFQIRTP